MKLQQDPKAFVTRNNTALPFFDGYALKSKLQMEAKESIGSMPNGTVIGPYLDGSSYVIAKKLDTRLMPDSVKCRHILIGTVDPRTGQRRRDDSTAKRKADEYFLCVKNRIGFWIAGCIAFGR